MFKEENSSIGETLKSPIVERKCSYYSIISHKKFVGCSRLQFCLESSFFSYHQMSFFENLYFWSCFCSFQIFFFVSLLDRNHSNDSSLLDRLIHFGSLFGIDYSVFKQKMPLFETLGIDNDLVERVANKHWGVKVLECLKSSQNHTFLVIDTEEKTNDSITSSWNWRCSIIYTTMNFLFVERFKARSIVRQSFAVIRGFCVFSNLQREFLSFMQIGNGWRIDKWSLHKDVGSLVFINWHVNSFTTIRMSRPSVEIGLKFMMELWLISKLMKETWKLYRICIVSVSFMAMSTRAIIIGIRCSIRRACSIGMSCRQHGFSTIYLLRFGMFSHLNVLVRLLINYQYHKQMQNSTAVSVDKFWLNCRHHIQWFLFVNLWSNSSMERRRTMNCWSIF